MTTADRIDFGWTAPPVAVALPDDETYIGKHRKPGVRSLSLLRMFYKPRHRG